MAAEAKSSHLMSELESSVMGPLRDKRLRLHAVEYESALSKERVDG